MRIVRAASFTHESPTCIIDSRPAVRNRLNPIHFFRRLAARQELAGLALLAMAVLFNTYYVAPELRIGRIPTNDVVYHLAASERMETSFARGEPFLDPWVSEWAFGYPVWRSYQPLPHVVAAGAIHVFRPIAAPPAVFASLFYLLIVTFPISVYIGARLLGLSPAAAGLASLLALAPSATGDPGRFGIGYGSVLWRGSGLYTQLFALHLMIIAVGLSVRALDSGGRWKRIAAGALLALTGLSHIIFGYAAGVSVVLLAVVGPRARRSERLVRLVTLAVPALALLAWFVLPLVVTREIAHHSRWQDPLWWDSYGAPFILRELFSGRLLDVERLPLLSIILAIGFLGTLLSWKDAPARRLLALCVVWLALFFGRSTWGHLMILAGAPADLPLHRFQAVFELSAIFAGSYGLVQWIERAAKRTRAGAFSAILAIVLAVLYLGVDRAGYLKQNAVWGEASLSAYGAERSDLEAALDDLRTILAERPGRVSAGKANSWGRSFRVGSVPLYAFLSRDHFDQASFLYHAMSRSSDAFVLRNEDSLSHDVGFGIRAVIAPADRPMPSHLRLRSIRGRFAVYESSAEGYFGTVDIAGHYVGPVSTQHEPSEAWLNSPLQPAGRVISLDSRGQHGPAVRRWEPLPVPLAEEMTLRGSVVEETKEGEIYRARIVLNRPGYAFIKITWSPDLVATVDGRDAPVIHVTPGFGAVPLPGGEHTVEVRYRPGMLKPFLFVFGIAAFGAGWYLIGGERVARFETSISDRVARAGERFSTPATAVTAALLLAGVVALHPLFRGKLIDGHDAACYPPRVVEMGRALGDGHIPPIWAPDLSSGHGQPLFQFLPPVPYLLAVTLRATGFGLTDSLQLGLFLLCLSGSAAVYRIGRLFQAPHYAAVGGAISWLFGPYLALDLFVRAAFAEAAAIAIAPIALWAILTVMMRPTALRIATGAIVAALLQLAHSAVALLMIPSVFLLALIHAITVRRGTEGEHSPRMIFSGPAAVVAGVALSAFFWVPSILEIQNVHPTRLTGGTFEWNNHILSPKQLLWSPWGYGASMAGPNDGMSYSLGLVHLALAIGGFAVALRTRKGTEKAFAITFAFIAVAGALLATNWTSWLWARVPLLHYLQFPWRALLLPALFLPLLITYCLERVGPRWSAVMLTILIVVNLPHTEPKGYLTYADEYYAPGSIARKGLNTTTFEEYEPRWVDERPPFYARPLLAISGPGEATEISRKTSRQEFSINTAGAARFETATFYYPGWTLTIDGAPAPLSRIPVRGTMAFDIPPGRHQVVLELRPTSVRRGALMLSVAAALLLAAAVVAGHLRAKPR